MVVELWKQRLIEGKKWEENCRSCNLQSLDVVPASLCRGPLLPSTALMMCTESKGHSAAFNFCVSISCCDWCTSTEYIYWDKPTEVCMLLALTLMGWERKYSKQTEELGGIIMLLHDFTMGDMNKYPNTPE